MKTTKIIKKNIKLLLRSKVSTLVLILGPLLVILIVGISFSSDTFNLKIGTYSQSYSQTSNSFVEKLNNKSFTITKFDTNDSCIFSIKEQLMHACIIFPPDMNIEKGKTNIVEFYVDQSQINLVYYVMSSLEESFGELSTEISKDLTNELINVLIDTKSNLENAQNSINLINDKNTIILDNSAYSHTNLKGLNFESVGSVTNVDTTINKINIALDLLLSNSEEFLEDANDVISDLEDYTITHKGNESNQGTFDDDLELLTDALTELESSIDDGYNTSTKELDTIIASIDTALKDMSSKLNEASTVNSNVLKKLEALKLNSEELKDESTLLNENVKSMISSINSIQIINSDQITTPITANINKLAQDNSNLGFLFPSLIVILVMFIGLLLPSTLVVMEKSSKAFFRIFTTPTNPLLFIIANYFTSLILISLQVFIILIVSQFYFDINLLDSFFISFISLSFITTLFIFIGMLIGDLFNTEEMTMLTSVSVATLLLLTSGLIFPIESMPKYIIEKIQYNPVVVGSSLFRKTLLFDSNFNSIKKPIGFLSIAILLVFGLILLVKKLQQTRTKRLTHTKIKKNILINYFDFGETKAKTLPEFIVSIQNLTDDKFQSIMSEGAIKSWLIQVLKKKTIAKKVEDKKIKQDILDVLVEELKKLQK